MLSLRSLTLGLMLTCSPAVAGEQEVVIIYYDNGGPVVDRIELIETYIATDVQVQVVGECLSACTLFAGMENVCTHPGAHWGFHGPWRNGGIRTEHFDLVSRVMAQFYPEELRHWWMMLGRWTPQERVIVLTGREMNQYGVPYCEDALP